MYIADELKGKRRKNSTRANAQLVEQKLTQENSSLFYGFCLSLQPLLWLFEINAFLPLRVQPPFHVIAANRPTAARQVAHGLSVTYTFKKFRSKSLF